jgi:glycosyltransferase involved in cell wall biosynthesis
MIVEPAIPPDSNARSDNGRVVWFDMTALFAFYLDNGSVTGIQRVEIMLLLELYSIAYGTESVQAGSKTSDHIRSCYFDQIANAYREAPFRTLNKRLRTFLAGKHKRSSGLSKALISLIPKPVRPERFLDKSLSNLSDPICRFQVDDVVVVLGAVWFRPPYVDSLLRTCTTYRLRLCIFMHDLIPVRFPEWFSPAYVNEMTSILDAVLQRAELVLSNSQHTAQDVRQYCEERNLPRHMPKVLRFGDEILLPEGNIGTKAKRRIAGYTNPGFVLMVGSIGIRKNQALLIKVWERLYRTHGQSTPYLVLIGKYVGRSNIGNLSSGATNCRIIHVPDCNDLELAEFYRCCAFTMFPSLAEGWGLPVAESLSCGKICIASDRAAIPEVGRDLVEYCGPNDVDRCYQLTERYFFDLKLRTDAEKRIIVQYRKTKWSETTRNMICAITDVTSQPSN